MAHPSSRLRLARTRRNLALRAALLAGSALAPLLAHADVYWDGAGVTWNAAADWTTSATGTGGTARLPTASDIVFFSAANVLANQATTLDAPQSALGLVFQNLGYSVSISNNTLTLGGNGITMNSGAASAAIASAVTLGAAQTWTNNSSNTLSISGNISNAANLLTIAGSGNTSISGILGSGAAGLTMNGTGLLTLSAANTYSGPTTLNAGTTSINSAAAVSNTLNLDGGALSVSVGNLSFAKTINVLAAGGALAAPLTGGVTDYSNCTITGSGPLAFSGWYSLEPLTPYSYSGTMTLAAASHFELSQTGLGSITNLVWGASNATGGYMGWWGNFNTPVNIYFQGGGTGETYTNGTETFAFSGALVGPGGFTYWGNAAYTSFVLSGATDNTNFSLLTHGPTSLAKTTSPTVHAIGGTLTINGSDTVTLAGAGDYQLADAATLAFGSTAGTVDLHGNNVRLDSVTGSGSLTNTIAATTSTVYWGVNNGTTTFSGTLKNNAGIVALVKLGTGVLTLTSTSSNYTGGIAIQAGTLQLGNSNVLPSANTITFGTASTSGTLQLNGDNLQIAGLASAPDATPAAQTITNSSVFNCTLTYAGGASTFGGTITNTAGTVALKISSGTLLLNGASNYTGGTTINAGALQLGDGASNGSITGNIANNANLTFDNASPQTFAGNITGSGTFAKQAAGILTLTATGTTYSGATTVSAGTLVAANTGGSATGSGSLTIAAAATLAGNGAISTGANSISISGAVAPHLGSATPTATLNLSTTSATGVSFNNGTNLNFAFGSTGASDLLNVNGWLTLNLTTLHQGTVTFNQVAASTYAPGNTYTLVTAASGINGFVAADWDVAGALPPGLAGTVSRNGNSLILTLASAPVPLTWFGQTNATWDAATTNWENTSDLATPNTFMTGDIVTFDNHGSTNPAVTVAAAGVSPASVTFANTSAVPYTLSGGAVSGATAYLVVNGGGAVTLSSANAYAGGTTVANASTLNLGNPAAAGAAGASITLSGAAQLALKTDTPVNAYNLNVTGNATLLSDRATSGPGVLHALGALSIGASTLTIAAGPNVLSGIAGISFTSLSLSGSPTFNITNPASGGATLLTLGAVTLGANTLTLTGNGSAAQSGAIGAGAGGLTLDAAFTGALTLTQSNLYSGPTAIQNGRLVIGSVSALAPSTLVTLGSPTSSGTLDLAGFSTHIAGLSLAAGAAPAFQIIGNSSTATASVLTLAASSAYAFAGTIQDTLGAGNRTVALALTSGTQTLSGANTYTGGTTLAAGQLTAASPSAFGAGSLQLNGGTLDLAPTAGINPYNTTIAGTLTIVPDRATPGPAVTQTLGTLSIGSCTLNVTQGPNVTSGNPLLAFGATTLTGSATLNPTTASLALAAVSGNNISLVLQGFAPANALGPITTGLGTVTLSGGTWTLSGASNYTGATSITAGALNLAGSLGNSPVNLSGGALSLQSPGAINQNTLTISGSATLAETVPNALSGSASLVISAPSSLTIAQPNNYSGPTTVLGGKLLVNAALSNTSGVFIANNGTLGGSGTIGGPVTINSNGAGGILLPHGASSATAQLTVTNAFTLSAGSVLNFNFAAPGVSDSVLGITNLTLAPSSTLNINTLSGFAAGVYELFGYSGTLTGAATDIHLGAIPATLPYTYTVEDPASGAPAGEIILKVSNKPVLTWTAHASTTWNATDANWTAGSGDIAFLPALATIFDDSVSAPNTTVTLIGALTPYQVIVNTAHSYQFQGAGTIADYSTGAASLIKNGSGTLAINNPNSYSGGTLLNAGVLQINNPAALGSLAVPLTLSAGTLEVTATFASARPLILANAGAMTLSVDDGVTCTAAGVISGDGVLNVNTNVSGTLALTAANTFTGGIVMAGTGTLSVASLAAPGAPQPLGTAASPLTLSTGGTLAYTGSSASTTLPLIMGSGGSTLNVASSSATLTLSGPVSGGALTVTGGALALLGANAFTDSLTIGNGNPNSGTVSINALAALPVPAINLNGGSFAVGNSLLTSGKTFNILPAGGTLSGNNAYLQLDGTTNITGTGPLTITAANHVSLRPALPYTYSGALTIAADARFELSQNGLGAVTNLIWAASAASGAYGGFWGDFNTPVNITFQGGASGEMWTNGVPENFNFSGSLGGAALASGFTSWGNADYASFTLSGPADNPNFTLVTHGPTFLAKSSSPSVHAINGTLTISSGDTVTIAGAGDYQLADNAALAFADSSSLLNLNGNNIRLDNVSGSGTITNHLAATTSTAYWGVNNGTTTFTGALQNAAGAVALAKIGSGTLTLSASAGASTYTAGTFIQNGTLQLGAANTLPAATSVVLGSASTSGTLDLNGFTQQVAGLAVAPGALPASQIITSTGPGSAPLVFAGTASTFAGTLRDTGGVYNLGLQILSGSLTLSGTANNYSGGTILYAGALVAANSAGSATGVGTVTLNGGTLASAPVGILAGPVVAGYGAHTIAPGGIGSLGTLNLGSTLSLNANSTLAFDVNAASSDRLNVTGALSIASGMPTLNLTLGALSGNDYILASFASAAGVTPASFNVTGAPLSGYTLVVDSTDLRLQAPSAMTWTAATNSTWDTSTSNWSPAPNTYSSFQKVVFNDLGLSRNVLIPAAVTPFSVSVTTSNAYSFSGPGGITGIASLVKDGTGTLTLTTANNYTGGTTIAAGTLQLGDGATNGSITGAVTNNATLLFDNPAAQTFTGTLTGTGALIKQSPAALTLANPATYSGPTTVAAGSLSLTGPQATSAISVANNAALVSGGSLSVQSVTFGNLPTDATALNVAVGTGLHPVTVTTSAGLVTHGAVTLNVAAATVLAAGEYPLVEYSGSVGGAGLPAFSLGTLPSRVIAALDTSAPGAVRLDITALDYPKWTGLIAGGAWDINNTPNWQTSFTLAPTTYLEAFPGDAVTFDDSAPGTRTVSLAAALHPLAVLVNNNAADYTFTGPGKISGPASLVKQGTGKLLLATLNDYTGGTLLQNGTLQLAADNALPIAGSVTLGSTGNAATLDLNAHNQTLAALATAGTPAAQTITNNGSADATLTLAATAPSTFAGAITNGPTNKTALALAGGSLTLAGPNTYSGGTTIASAQLTLAASNALPPNGPVTLSPAGILDLGGLTASLSAGTLSFRGGTLQNGTLAGTNPFDAQSGAAYASLAGSASLIKSTSATFVLGAPSNYTGGTLLQNGTLQLAADNALPVAGALTLGSTDNAATLDLNGHTQTLAALATSGTAAAQTITNNSTAPNAPATLAFAGGASTFAGAINDGPANSTAIHLLAGTLALSGSGNYSGGTTLTSGTLNINADTALGSPASPLTFAGGTLQAGAPSISLNTTRPVAVASAATASIDTHGNSLTLGTITGPAAGGLTKSGAGTLTIATPSTYGGTTLISAGTLQIGASPAPILANAVVNLDANTVVGNPSTVPAIANLGTGGGSFLNNGTGLTGPTTAPAYSSSAINGHPALVFTGGMTLGSSTAYVNQSNAVSIFLVENQTATQLTNYPGELSFVGPAGAANDWDTPGNMAVEDNYAGDEIRTFTGYNVAGADSYRPALNNPLVWGTVLNTSANPSSVADMVSTGGIITTVGTAAANTPFHINQMLIGGRVGNATTNGNWNGDIGQILIFNTALSASDRTAVEAYLASRWSLNTPVAFLPAATPVQIAPGATLDLDGYTQQVASLSDPVAGGGGGLVSNSAPAIPATLILADGASSTFSGSLQDGAGTVALTLNGSGTQILAATNNYSGATSILAGTLSLAAPAAISRSPITLTGGALLETVPNALSGTASLTLNGPAITLPYANNYSGGTTVSAGTLTLANTAALGAGPLTLAGGAVRIQPGLTAPASALIIPQLSLSAGTLDLTNNLLLIRSNSDLTALIRNAVRQGLITTSLTSDPASRLATTVGYLTGAAYASLHASSSFGGATLAPADEVLRWTYPGDINLDGLITAADFRLMDAGYLQGFDGTTKIAAWINGDVNHDGLVNAADFALAVADLQGTPLGTQMDSLYAAEFGPSFTNAYNAALLQPATPAIPEPASLLLLALAAPALLRRQPHRTTSAPAPPV